MKLIFGVGDKKKHSFRVKNDDIAQFESGKVHDVCATFTLAREIEWATRLFVLEMKDIDEEGIGTSLSIEHKSPAIINEVVEILAEVKSIIKNELICSYEAKVGERVIATGQTGQKILKKDKLVQIFDKLKEGR
jgi:fluoroacetyl-CoA thioesterase